MIKKRENIEIPLTRKPEACPKTGFFDSKLNRTGSNDKPVFVPVLEQKTIFSEQSEKDDIIKNIEDLPQMRRDLETFRSTYLRTYGGIECVEVFVGAFLKDCPGYNMLFPRQAIIFEAEKICNIIPQSMSSVVTVEEAARFLKEEGY